MFSYVYCDYVRYQVIIYNISIGKYVCLVSGLSILFIKDILNQCGNV